MTKEIKNDVAVTFPEMESDGFTVRMELLIKEAGSATALARMAGVSESVVRKWRNGKSDPSRTNLVALSTATGTSIAWLAAGEGDMRSAAKAPTDFDTKVFARVLTGIELGLQEGGYTLTPEKKVDLALALYDIFKDSDKEPSTATILPFLKVGAS